MAVWAYVDCFSGASGDMFLGALVDAGLAPDDLRADLATLHLDEFTLAVEPVTRKGLAGTKVTVTVSADSPRRGPKEVAAIIEASGLPRAVKKKAKAVFQRLAEAEAKVHGEPVDHVHFHEVGAVDAIVDVVGTCAGLARLGVERLVASPVAVGSGQVQSAHGPLPVPAPATAELLAGVPVRGTEEPGELTTPTGAALLVTLADAFGPVPAMRILRTGYGAGTRLTRGLPNLLRLIIGEPAPSGGRETERQRAEPPPTGSGPHDNPGMGDGPAIGGDEMWMLQTNLDDLTGEVVGFLYDRLFAAGAVDVFTTAIQMKKNRPGVLVSVLAPVGALGAVERVLFDETTTFGVRRFPVSRRILEREHVEVETAHGRVRVKVGRLDGAVTSVAPEYEDCRRIAEATGRPIKSVYAEALAALWQRSAVSGQPSGLSVDPAEC